MYSVMTFVLPFAVLTSFSVLLIRVYRAQRRRRAAMMMTRGSRSTASTTSTTSATSNDEHSVTRVIVVVMVVFAVCNLPAKVLENVFKGRPDCGTVAYVARRLSFVLEVANSTANFIIYCALRRQFRDGLRRALMTPRQRRQSWRQQAEGVDGRWASRHRARTVSPLNVERLQIVALQPNVETTDGDDATGHDLELPLYDRNTA